ncbi:MAG: protein translocase subunit SecD [Chlamydiota bacterium]
MHKTKRWQSILILAVTVLTLYNILPTIFFYIRPLGTSINEPKANELSIRIAKRINTLEPEAISWLKSFCTLLNIKPKEIKLDKENVQNIQITFTTPSDAKVFKKYLPKAGALIPFVPAQLSLYGTSSEVEDKTITLQRNIGVHFDPNLVDNFFQFSTKFNDLGQVALPYQALVKDRLTQVALSLGGVSQNAQFAEALRASKDEALNLELSSLLSDNLVSFIQTFGDTSDLSKRYFSTFFGVSEENKVLTVQDVIKKITQSTTSLTSQISVLNKEESDLREQGKYLEATKIQLKDVLSSKLSLLNKGIELLQKNTSSFTKASTPWTYANIALPVQKSFDVMQAGSFIQTLPLSENNPFIESIQINWQNGSMLLNLYPDILQLKQALAQIQGKKQDIVEGFIFNELAYVSRQTDEVLTPSQGGFKILLSELENSKSFLTLKLSSIAEAESREIKNLIISTWAPTHADLQPSVFPIIDYSDYLLLPADQKNLSLVVYSPVCSDEMPKQGFRMNSIYVIAKGLGKIVKSMQSDPSSPEAQLFLRDFQKLRSLLSKSGYMSYEASLLNLGKEFAGDFIFEAPDYFQNILAASREDFYVKGTKRYAVLEFTNVEQRILTENKIDSKIHEDLLKWRDDYVSAQLSLKGASRFDIPKPTHNILLSNIKLSTLKYFRGDDRKILHWGLDLSGGKTVLMELRDSNNKLVTNEADIKQGINELYSRVNKMGVSEVNIRQEGNLITLDFPGSQHLSATELVKASSMFFHVVYEKFTPNNATLSGYVSKFLQEIWNEAVVTNQKEADDINRIAFKHLYGESLDPDVIQPRSESAKILYEQGLRLTNPLDTNTSNLFNDAYAKIALFRGDDYTNWQGQTHPLLIVFKNYALSGSDLEDVHASYDPSRGNFLSFSVKGSYTSKEGIKINPRDDFSAWTTPFCKEKITGTANGQFSHNLGWRMAVILNGSIISAPTLDSPLKDSAMITGSFSQREISQLEADLKAGSLTFTPKILSEQNVSPELGSKERNMGIWATILALILVIAVMIGYYRFSGLVASVAVLFNLLIMWATLQNIQARLSLSSLAGLILTVGMAVDANVLVFERIREEFSSTGRIASAVQAGYKKAFSAILDSNITTVIAALILLQFHSGPIKGFAVTLIIGIISSMFTALFMTKYFFSRWIQNPKHKSLTMMNCFKAKKFNFLKYAKPSMIVSIVVIVLGGSLFVSERHSLFGMDFTGGYALTLEVKPSKDLPYRYIVEKSLIAAGAKAQEIQVRELSPSNNVRIFLSRSLELPGRPLAGMANSSTGNLPIKWIISSLQKEGIELTESSLENISQNWSEVSGQMSQTMRNSAILGLLVALLCIFIYIAIRFEFKYAVSATICLLHDIIFTLASIALLHILGVPVQIDLTTIAALLTIAGYSLNDTIIVFDRIREETKSMKRSHLPELINHALNITLSRTILTSGTTLLVLIPLIFMGGSTIFGFALVMAIGVVFGTLSSLFIAAPLMLFFHEKESKKQQRIAVKD